jgi:thiamine-phosphate pyrophosphorylase
MTPLPTRGLYAIADTSLIAPERLVAAVEQAVLGGAVAVQYRDKSGYTEMRRRQGRALLEVCREHRVPLIINDDTGLALELEADGVHLGKDDATLAEARRLLGEAAIVGASCYNRAELALNARAQGADYVALGRFFPSSSKPRAVQASVEMLAEVRPRLRLPIVVIGGITPENGASLLEAGADMLAVIQGVFGQPDPRAAAARYAALFA